MKIIIITRHPALVEWLRGQGVVGYVYSQVVTEREPMQSSEVHIRDLQGTHVIGVLPTWIAASGPAYISEVALPGLPSDARGKEFTVEQMNSWGAQLISYYPPKRLSEDEQKQLL